LNVLTMLHELSENDREKVRALANRLIATNFLVKEKERETYMLIRRYRQSLEQFFHFLGWELVVDERHECVFLHTRDQALRRRLNREQSIWMLVLRLIYQEKRQSLSLSEYPMTTTYEIRSKYETFRLPFIQRTKLEEMVRLCTRYQLLEAIDSDVRSDDCRYRLFHTWQYVIQAEELTVLREKVARYVTETEGGLLDEVVEETEID